MRMPKHCWGLTHMNIKTPVLLFVALATVMLTAGLAAAADFDFKIIEVNDLDVTLLQNLDIERTNTIDVEVTLQGDASIPGKMVDNVRVIAEINGYEFGEIKDISEQFSIEENITRKVTLRLLLPDDIDAAQFYTLRIRAVSATDAIEQTFALHIDPMRHALNLFDIIFNPSNTITAGNPVFVSVMIENLGEKEEENAKVTAMVPKLGISSSAFLKDLVSQIQEENEQFKDDEQSNRPTDLMLRIPEDAPAGDYEVIVRVDYNRGNSFIEGKRILRVIAAPVSNIIDAIVGPDSTSRQAAPGEEVSYKLSIANVGNVKTMFQVMVDGAQLWSQIRVEPAFLTILPEATGEIRIFAMPNDDAAPKIYNFVARVMADGEIVAEVPLSLKVLGEKAPATAPTTGPAWSFKNILAALFAVLVIILIILGLIIAFRKVQEEDESQPAGSAAEAQTYYYHPKR